tara:strand:+ start:256 stop:465 length:210 start_codon:yes stop_codon:yes gene_type:complete
MTSTSISSVKPEIINERSTKQAIIDAANEYISLQDNRLNYETKLVNTLKEERQALTYLLIATSSFALLF